jgi:biotin transport system permease protein
MLTGLYLPGSSLVHRTRPGVKLLVLLVFSTVLVAWSSALPVTGAALLVAAGYTLAGLSPRVLVAQVWPLRWVVLLLAPFQVWSVGPERAYVVVATLVVAVAAASLVTVTTPLTAMLEAVITGLGPFRRLGVDPERMGLLVALTLRAIPVVGEMLEETREARAARGLERSTRALVTPIVVRTVDHAGRVGEALAARGEDD